MGNIRITSRTAVFGLLAVALVIGPAAGAAGAAGNAGETGAAAIRISAQGEAASWAADALNRWVQAGILQGYPDGSLQPNRPITRAEFAAIVNRLFGLTEESGVAFADAPSAWAGRELSRSIAAGYLSPGAGSMAEANRPLTRAEVSLALNKLFELEAPAQSGAANWPDLTGLGDETAGAVRALASGGYLKGMPDGTFRPGKTITRAELATVVDRLIALFANRSGEIEPGSIGGNAVVQTAGAVLKGGTIGGNLYLTQGIGVGGATLKQTVVLGTTFVRGGAGGIELTDAKLKALVLEGGHPLVRTKGSTTIESVRFRASGALEAGDKASAAVPLIQVEAGADEVKLTGEYGRVVIQARGSAPAVLVVSGHIAELSADGSVRIQLAEGATIDKLTVSAGAGGSTAEGAGRIGAIDDRSGTFVNRAAITTGASGSSGGSGQGPTDPGQQEAWHLVWSDDFGGSEIDRTKWTFDTTNGESVGNPGWGNNELEYYTDRAENATVEDGHLVITARKESYGGMPYTSARLKTKGLFSQAYGKFEIRAKAPTGKGYWPAIWMLPETYEYGGWAASGEIDIMEGWGSKPGTVAGTIHYGEAWPGNVYSGNSYELPDNGTIADFHTYALEWEPNEMRWYVDGKLFSVKSDWYSRGIGQHDNYSYPAPFDEPFHLLLNLAVGGNFDGNPTADTVFPGRMEVDYVRVYAKDQYAPATPPTYAKEAYAPGSNLPQDPDGDLVYNGDFKQDAEAGAGMGAPGTAHWSLYQDPGASGKVTIDDIGGTNYAHVTISNAGGNSYSIQPQAIVSLAKGRNYKLTFEAKTDTSRNMTVRLTGGESRGYAAYSQTLDAALTSDFRTYEMLFQMKDGSDPAARIEFNLGTNAHPVWFGKVKLVEIDSIPFDHDSAKQPQDDGNHVYNGTFDQGEPNRMSYWHLTTANGASASASVPSNPPSERKLDIAIAGGGSAAGDVRLLQKGVQLLQDNDYKLTFDASAQPARDIQVGLYAKDGTPIDVRTVSLPASTGRVTADFARLNAASETEGQLIFSMGGAAGQVRLDNVRLERTSAHFDPDTVFYPLRNGDFGDGIAYWETSGNDDQAGAAGAGAIRLEAANGEAKATVDRQGGKPWNALVFQSGIPVKAGIAYELSFEARSTADRPMEVVVENAAPRQLDQTVELTNEYKAYSFEFKPGKSESVGLKFLLGLIHPGDPQLGSHDVIFRNVRLLVKNAPYAQPPSLAKDSADNLVGRAIALSFRDDPNWRAAVTKVAVNGAALAADQYTLTAGQLELSAGVFPAAGSYTVTVSAAGYADTSVSQAVLSADGNLVANGDFASGTANWSTWSGEGGDAAFTAPDGVGTVAVASKGTPGWANQLYQEGIPMEAGATYELAFDASATANRPITVEFTNTSGGSRTFELSSAMTTYKATFTVNSAAPLKLNFLLGNVSSGASTTPDGAHTIRLDNIAVRKIDSPDPNSNPDPGPSGHELVNGTFDSDAAGWSLYNKPYESDAVMAVENGVLNVQWTGYDGYEMWGTQVYQEGLRLKAGKTYTLSLKIKSTIDQEVWVSVEKGDNNSIHYLEVQKNALTGGDGFRTLTFDFTMGSDTVQNGKLVLQMGGDHPGAHTISLDDIELTEHP